MASILGIASSVPNRLHIFCYNNMEVNADADENNKHDNASNGVVENELNNDDVYDVSPSLNNNKTLDSFQDESIFISRLNKIQVGKTGNFILELKDKSNLDSENKILKFNFQHLSIDPMTCTSLNSAAAFVECRFSATYLEKKCAQYNVTAKSETERLSKELNCLCSILCSHCNLIIADLTGISSVSDVYDEALQETVPSFFCHAHGEDDDLSKLPEKMHDVQYNGTALILPSGLAARDALSHGGRNLVLCSRCFLPLGKKTALGRTSFYPCQLSIEKQLLDVDGDVVGKDIVSLLSEESFLNLLLQLICNADSASRVIILAVTDTQVYECLLLWFLEGCSKFYHHRIDSNQTSLVNIEALSVNRLLFLPSADETFSPLLSVWSKDISVGSLVLPEQLALQLMNVLLTSCEHLPTSLQKANGFFCAFSPCNFAKIN